MKAGKLRRQEELQAYIRKGPPSQEKQICGPDGRVLFVSRIRSLISAEDRCGGDVRGREYILLDGQGVVRASARPGYAAGEDPERAGWPVNRMPRVDHAAVRICGDRCRLTMRSGRCYHMAGADGRTLLQISHLGLAGGWAIEAEDRLSPGLVCGMFVFCRYLERENEFLVV